MRTRHDLPIAWRLGAGFLAVLAVMVAFGVFMLGSYQRSEAIQRAFMTRHVPLDDASDALERAVLHVAIAVRSYALAPDAEARRNAVERLDGAQAALARLRGAGGTDRDRAIVGKALPLVQGYLERVRAIVSEGKPLDPATERDIAAAREAALAPVHELVAEQHAHRTAAVEDMERNRARLAMAGVIAFVLVLCIFGFVSFYTMRSIQRPTRDLVRIASAMRAGDWKPALEWSPEAVRARGDRANPRSELARIAHAFGSAAVALDRREARLRADARVAAATASSLRKDALAAAVLEAIVEGSGATNAVFYATQEGGGLVDVARRGTAPPDAPAVAERALREGGIFRDEPPSAGLALAFGREPLGAIVLDAVKPFGADAREFLRATGAQVAVGLANVIAHEKAQFLAGEVQARNEEIQAQMEEIQTQSEQLQAQNEELQTQAEQIAESNARLRQQAGELTHADERKNEFLALLAHELRNPLAAISSSIFMLAHPRVQPRQAEQARAVIERQMRHLTRMIDDLLDVTRISRGKLRLQRESLDLAQVVREAIEDQRGAIESAGLMLDVRMPERPVRVLGDRMRLGQVLSNILHNACKFTPAGGRITVALNAEPDERNATVRVTDTGVGIPAHLLEQLFQPFRQGEEPHARTNAGLGLGLALARALVQMHGGRIGAQSAGPGSGSEFAVTLPLEGAGRASADARAFVDAGRRDGIVSEDLGDT